MTPPPVLGYPEHGPPPFFKGPLKGPRYVTGGGPGSGQQQRPELRAEGRVEARGLHGPAQGLPGVLQRRGSSR